MLETVTALVDTGYRVVVVLPAAGALIAEIAKRGGVATIRSLPVLRKSALKPRGFIKLVSDSTSGLMSGLALIRAERPAMIYASTITVPLWILLGRLARVPVLVHVHEGEKSASTLVKRVLALPLLAANRVVANSFFSVGVLGSAFERLGQTEVLYNGVASPVVRTSLRSEITGEIRLLYMGRLSPRKGVDVAVRAVGHLADQGVIASLDIVGSAYTGYEWYRDELVDLVDSLGIADRVRFRGFQDSVWDSVAEADIVLVPSRLDEPFGNTAVEAVLAGRPVIASATSGLIEATDGYASARVVQPGDAQAISDAVLDLVGSWTETVKNVETDTWIAERRHAPRVYRERIVSLTESMTST